MPMVIGIGLSWKLAKREQVGSSTTVVVILQRVGTWKLEFESKIVMPSHYAQIATPFVKVNLSNKELPPTGTSVVGSHQVVMHRLLRLLRK